jgi:hypothetical protein
MTREVNYDEEELNKLKDEKYKFMDKIRGLRKNIREINTSMNATKNLIQVMDDELKLMLDNETNEMVLSNFSLFDDWWSLNIEITNEESIVVSTDVWFRFKQENKDLLKEFEITPEKFKQFIKSKVPMSCITIKNKNANSAFDIKGIKFKEYSGENCEKKIVEKTEIKKTEIKETGIIEVELNEEVINKKKKIIKKK